MAWRPIEQLYGLLRKRLEVGDRIQKAQAELDQIKTSLSNSLVQQALDRSARDHSVRERLMTQERSQERILQALRDAKIQIEERIGAAAEKVIEAEISQLRSLSEQHQNALKDCLSRIDENILSFCARINEYRGRCSELAEVNESLARLGAAPLLQPRDIPSSDILEILQSRFRQLQDQGKI